MNKGGLRVRQAGSAADMAAVLALRGLCFRGDPARPDGDAQDPQCLHMMIEGPQGALWGSYRIRAFGADLSDSYAAQFYAMAPVAGLVGPFAELGRFCVHPEAMLTDVVRVAWGALAAWVVAQEVQVLFGCASFPGNASHDACFELLRRKYLGPEGARPGIAAPKVIRFAPQDSFDRKAAMAQMPPLLRSYLSMGGWVSDHAVIDADLGTQHVLCVLDIAAIPAARAQTLRAIAAE